MNIKEESLKKHYEWKGKIEVVSRVPVTNKEQLSLAYTPGVAEACLVINKDVDKSYELTRRWNLVAVVTDGTAVLGLGDIGPEAGMPVMEGKCALFKAFADVDAFPICIKSKDVDEIVRTVQLISGSFGGVNLEDISAPRCFEVEKRLKEICDIPVFHDDQHGTAIIVAAAVINACKVLHKDIHDCVIAMSGAGAAGTAIMKHLLKFGPKDIIMNDKNGLVCRGVNEPVGNEEIAYITNKNNVSGTLKDAMKGADIFVGVSAPNIVTPEMIKSMNKNPIVFALANPVPEIMPEDAKNAGAAIVGSGRSDYPNQINNVLAFPGIFKGALRVRAKEINEEMKMAASYALANFIPEKELSAENILPRPFDKGVADAVADAVAKAAIKTGVARLK